ncbi:hypothetical protein ABZP36_034173 [Zizania latifolia]
MFSAVRSGALGRWRSRGTVLPRFLSSTGAPPVRQAQLLELSEVEKVLSDVRAGDVRVFPVGEGGLHGGSCADYMVVATGRSDWHIKQKQKGSDRILMPSVEGQQAGKWIVVDSGSIVIHTLEERAREYYDLESIWTKAVSPNISVQAPCTHVLGDVGLAKNAIGFGTLSHTLHLALATTANASGHKPAT